MNSYLKPRNLDLRGNDPPYGQTIGLPEAFQTVSRAVFGKNFGMTRVHLPYQFDILLPLAAKVGEPRYNCLTVIARRSARHRIWGCGPERLLDRRP